MANKQIKVKSQKTFKGELGALELRPVKQDCKLPFSIVEGEIDVVVERSVAPAA